KPQRKKAKVLPTTSKHSKWAVPYEPVIIPMGEKALEKILAQRIAPAPPHQEELLVKYKVGIRNSNAMAYHCPDDFFASFCHKNMSYLHVEWVPRNKIEAEEHLGKNRVKKFIEKQTFHGQGGDQEAFNPAYLKVRFTKISVASYFIQL